MTSQTGRAQVLISGAGPTGLTLACDLARRGIAVRIFEKMSEPFPGSRAKGHSGRCVEVYDDLGIAPDLLRLNARGPGVVNRVFSGDTVIAEYERDESEPTPDLPYPSGVMGPQWRTEGLLRGLLETYGVQVEFDHEIIGLSQNASSVVTTIRTAEGIEEVTADYCVGADGSQSTVRRLLGTNLTGEQFQPPGFSYVGDVVLTGLEPGCQYIWNDPEVGFVALTGFMNTDCWQFQATPRHLGDPPPPSLEYFQSLLNRLSRGMSLTLVRSTWLSSYGIGEWVADEFRSGRVFLAGDAAHQFSPAGQGMNSGVQDSHNLGWKLAAVLSGAPCSLLDTYEEERRPLALASRASSGRRIREFLRQIQDTAGPLDVGRIMGSPDEETDPNLPVVVPDTLITYAGRTLAPSESHATSNLRVGDRAPDAVCRSSSTAAPVRLFDLFRGPHWTAIVFASADTECRKPPVSIWGEELRTHLVLAGHADPDPAPLTVCDPEGVAHQIYGISEPTSILVRPDGYIGSIVRGTDLTLAVATVQERLTNIGSGDPDGQLVCGP